MMSIPFLKIVAALLLLVVPGYLLLRFDMQLLQRLAKTIVRMAVQMAVVAGVLWALWRFDSPWLCLLWIVVMSVVVAWMLLRRARLPQTLLLPVVGGLLAGVLTVGSYVLLVVLRPEHALSARWMIPVAAVLLAHMLATNVRGVSAYFESLRSDSASYYTQLGNGKSRLTALTPYVRQALRSMVEPAARGFAVASPAAVWSAAGWSVACCCLAAVPAAGVGCLGVFSRLAGGDVVALRPLCLQQAW